jgi:hypothetical protein
MKFSFFEALSKEEAQEYLDEFLLFGKNRGMEIINQAIHFTVDIDFSIESLSPVFKSLLTVLKTIPREPDLSLPEFIRNTEEYKKNLFDFDEPSKSVVLAAAYYLGETFVRNYEQLSWATGNTKYAEGNMPVVTTFKHDIEMAPILIMENMFGRVISRMGDETSIDTAINAWVSDIPN